MNTKARAGATANRVRWGRMSAASMRPVAALTIAASLIASVADGSSPDDRAARAYSCLPTAAWDVGADSSTSRPVAGADWMWMRVDTSAWRIEIGRAETPEPAFTIWGYAEHDVVRGASVASGEALALEAGPAARIESGRAFDMRVASTRDGRVSAQFVTCLPHAIRR